MKMIVQADDYGMTAGVTDGIVACGRKGVLTQTGLFTNMGEDSEYAVRRWKNEIPHVSLGQDINFATGYPVTDPKLIPTMVQENGAFLTSSMHRALDKTNKHHVSYEDALLEGENQVKRFIELVGRAPDYIGGHAYSSDETSRAINELAHKYGAVPKLEFIPMFETTPEVNLSNNWVKPRILDSGKIDFSMDVQLGNDPIRIFEEGIAYLREHEDDPDAIAYIHSHAGYMDRDLIRLSSFTAIRLMEADFICSDVLKQWVREKNVELVSFKDIYGDFVK